MKAKRIAELKNAMAIARMNHDWLTASLICAELSAVIATASKPCSDQLRAELTANNIEMNRLTERNDAILSILRGRGFEPVALMPDEILVGNTIRRKSETPLTNDQLRAGDWFCRSISEVTRLALLAKGFKSMSGKWPCEMHDYKYCSMGWDGHAILLREVDLESYAHDRLSEGVTLREIRRVADQFYYV